MSSLFSDTAVIGQIPMAADTARNQRGFWALIARVPGGVQRQHSAQPAALDDRRDESREVRSRDLRFCGDVPLLAAIPYSQHARRLVGGPLQQAAGHDLDESNGVRIDAAGDGRAGNAHIGAFSGSTHPGCESGGTLWTVKVWFAAGTSPGKELVVGERRNRV